MSNEDRLNYYRRAARFWLNASELQRTRCLATPNDADVSRADLNFYVVSVQRIREVARMVADRGKVSGAQAALDAFDSRWPRFQTLRNVEEHITGPSKSQASYGVWYFSHAVADLGPGGSVDYLERVEDTQVSVRSLAEELENLLSSALGVPTGG